MTPAGRHAHTAQTVSLYHAVITGAGFIRSLVPGAPLPVDEFGNDVLECGVRSLADANQQPDWKQVLQPIGHFDIESYMTRPDALMLHDCAENAGNAVNE